MVVPRIAPGRICSRYTPVLPQTPRHPSCSVAFWNGWWKLSTPLACVPQPRPVGLCKTYVGMNGPTARSTKTLPAGRRRRGHLNLESGKQRNSPSGRILLSVKDYAAEPDSAEDQSPGGSDAPKHRRSIRMQGLRSSTRLRETLPLST